MERGHVAAISLLAVFLVFLATPVFTGNSIFAWLFGDSDSNSDKLNTDEGFNEARIDGPGQTGSSTAPAFELSCGESLVFPFKTKKEYQAGGFAEGHPRDEAQLIEKARLRCRENMYFQMQLDGAYPELKDCTNDQCPLKNNVKGDCERRPNAESAAGPPNGVTYHKEATLIRKDLAKDKSIMDASVECKIGKDNWVTVEAKCTSCAWSTP